MKWLIKIAIKKGVARGVMAIGALLASTQAQQILAKYGVTLDLPAFETTVTVLLTGFAMAGFEFVRNWLKVKKGIKLP